MASAAKAEPPRAFLSLSLTEAESRELIAAAGSQDFATWARETLQAAARRSGGVLVEFTADEQLWAARTAQKIGLTLGAFVRRATVAACRRVGSRG